MATNHTYSTGKYGTKSIELHIIKTSASNIKLVNLREKQTLKQSEYYGTNGGFFNMGSGGQSISIGIYNGTVVGSDKNNWNGGGILAWNGSVISAYRKKQNASDVSFWHNNGTWLVCLQ